MATLDEIRAVEAEFLTTLESLRTRVEQQNQAIVDLIKRGNITPAEAEAINQRAAQTNQEIEAFGPLLRKMITLLDEGAGFFNQPAVNEIGTRVTAAQQSFTALTTQARTNRQEMNRLAGTNQAATKEATDAKAATDQGPGTVSAGETTAEAQQARSDTANPQLPNAANTGNVASISNADSSTPTVPSELDQVPKLPPGQARGTPVDPRASNSAQPAPGSGVNVLQTNAAGTSQQLYVYKAVSCVSRFSRGQFTQELEGVLLQFPQDAIRNFGNVTAPAGTTAQAQSGSTAQQADARRVDNALDAQRTPDQSAAESARLSRVGVTPDQSGAETARLAAQAGRAAAGAVSAVPGAQDAVALGQGLVTSAAGATGLNPALVPFASPGATNVIGAVATAASLTGNPQINRAAQALVPAQSFVATSLGQPVGLGQQGRGASQSVVARTPTVTVNLIAGGTTTVTTVDQALVLYNQGRISLEQRDRALSQLASLQAAQQPQQTVDRQSVGYEP